MAECDVYFIEYADELMAKRGLGSDDKMLITAILCWEPLTGKAVYSNSGSLRTLDYIDVRGERRHDVFYAYFPNADIQLNARDVAIVISVDESNSRPGHRLEPESVARIVEMIAELTRYVFG
jgi:hypothetical protein